MVLFTEGRCREASWKWRRMRRLRPGFANPGSGGWTKAVRPTLRSGCMSNDAISGGAAAGSLGYLRATLSCGSPSHRPLRSPGDRICPPGPRGGKRHRQRRTAGPDRIAARGAPKGSY